MVFLAGILFFCFLAYAGLSSIGVEWEAWMFVVAFIFGFVVCIPAMLLSSFSNGLVDRSADRADERQKKLISAVRKRKSGNTYVDARSVSFDNRSIKVAGDKPRECENGTENEE
jgi:4-hydroxybenzoate polyprenyltransferase